MWISNWKISRSGDTPHSYLGVARFEFHLGHHISWDYSWFFSLRPGKFQIGTSILTWPLSSKYFSVHHSFIILSFDVILSSYWQHFKILLEVNWRLGRLCHFHLHSQGVSEAANQHGEGSKQNTISFLLGLFFDSENAGHMFVRNVG
jgi:hypothetical protein